MKALHVRSTRVASDTDSSRTGRAAVALRSPRAEERDALLRWLDSGLRAGRAGRLEAEYPTALDPGRLDDHVLAVAGGRPASHALAHLAEARVGPRRVRTGMIGLVYTDPSQRGRGLARACIEAALERLAARGAQLALLWSDLDGFYTRLGFRRAGIERLHLVDRTALRRARARLGGRFTVRPPAASDWPALEALYGAKTSGIVRPSGALARLAAAPECRIAVAERSGRPVAYAAVGRGDDLRGVVHEWAGDPAGVLACLEPLMAGAERVGFLSGPAVEAPVPALRAAGAEPHTRPLGWMRILDPQGLWRALAAGVPELEHAELAYKYGRLALHAGARSAPLEEGDALALLFGPCPPAGALAPLDPATARALSRAAPWPLFLWGFDSV